MPQETLDLLNELEMRGLNNAHFRKLHHRQETITAHRRYCQDRVASGGTFRTGDNNQLVRARLRGVLEYLEGGKTIDEAVQLASQLDLPRGHWTDLGPDEFDLFEARRLEACDFWGELIWHARQRAARDTEDLLLDLIDRATWAATEVSKRDDDRYLNQRYVSAVVAEQIAQAQVDGTPKPGFWRGMRHEHVFPRGALVPALRQAPSQAEVVAILKRSCACVVTRNESELLEGVEHLEGWKRFRELGIAVYDRRERKPKLI